MNNPWQEIDLKIYEEHMSSLEVFQLQTLNEITREQLQDSPHSYVGFVGVAGGNGLENIDISQTKKVYAIDVNQSYITICKKRYGNMGGTLELFCEDITDEKFKFPYTDLLICNLIIEYIGEKQFVSVINRNVTNVNAVSCVIQKNRGNSFVSSSKYDSHFEPLLSIHHNIDENELVRLFLNINYHCVRYKTHPLPNGKEFIRMDFEKGAAL